MRKIDTMLVRMIKNSKSQFMAVLLIIVLGICVFTALNMSAMNLDRSVTTYYQENHFPDLFVQLESLPVQKVMDLEKIEGVKAAQGRITMDVPFLAEALDERVTLRLTTAKGTAEELSAATFIKGKPFSQSGKEVLLVQQFAVARNIGIGDEIKLQINGKQQVLEVVGIVENPEHIYIVENSQSIMPAEGNFGIGYVNESFGREATGMAGSYNEVLIQCKAGVDEEALIDELEEQLDPYGLKQIIKKKDQLSNAFIQEEIKSLKTMAQSLPVLFLLVAGLILMMMLSRMVKKDRLKIGLLKAMGYSKGKVLLHYVKYALVAGVSGGLLGSVLGMTLAGFMTRLYLQFFHVPIMRASFDYSYILLAILLSVVFCAASGLIGARGVLKISPSEAMRSESPKRGKRILLERMPFYWKRLSFSNKVVMRNIFRNKKRTLFVLSGVIVTYGMMLFTTSMPAVIDDMMVKHFAEFQKMDYSISFKTPVTQKAVRDMEHLIHVDHIEGKLEYPFELSNGNKKRNASIVGLDRDTKFYEFRDASGRKVTLPEEGLLISDNLAKALNVENGDLVRVKNFIPGKEDVYLPVRGIVKQTLGMNGYMNVDSMGAALLEKNAINGVFVNSSDGEINKKLLGAANIASIMSVADIQKVYEQYMQLMVFSIGFMMLFSGVLGFAIVYNSTIVSLSEREVELSSYRVLGFSKWQIFLMILKENNMIMVAGILLGIPVGKAFADYSAMAFQTDMYTIDMNPTFSAGVMAAVATVIFIFFAQLATYQKIKGLDFLQALKNRES